MRGFLFCNNETFVDFGIFFLLVKRKRTCGKTKLHTFAANSHIIVNQLRIYIENHSYLCSNFIFFKAKVGLSVFFCLHFTFGIIKGVNQLRNNLLSTCDTGGLKHPKSNMLSNDNIWCLWQIKNLIPPSNHLF